MSIFLSLVPKNCCYNKYKYLYFLARIGKNENKIKEYDFCFFCWCCCFKEKSQMNGNECKGMNVCNKDRRIKAKKKNLLKIEFEKKEK